MSKLVSVVVPIFNVENFLDKCIESIINQSYNNLEIILVDDGSTDNCPAMCDQWAKKDGRIKVIHKVNAGLGMARNTGLDLALGEYIFFLDSDDYVDTTLVEKCVRNAEKYGSCVVAFGRSDAYSDGRIEKFPIKSEQKVFEKNDVVCELLPAMFSYDKGFGISVCCKMFCRETLIQSGCRFLSERELISEDSFFALQFFPNVQRVSVIEEPLYYYYKRSTSLTRSFKSDRQKKNDEFLIKCIEYIDTFGLPKEVSTHVMARYHGMTLGTLMQIERADIPRKQKRQELKSIYHNKTLRMTLTEDVVKWDAGFPRLFWRLLRMKWYPICSMLLFFNKFR